MEKDKIKDSNLSCPGSKIRSKGLGKGLGFGQGKGPVGNPKDGMELSMGDGRLGCGPCGRGLGRGFGRGRRRFN